MPFSPDTTTLALAWTALASAGTMLLFATDKLLARNQSGRRIAETTLLAASALGGWPGGLLSIVIFRHKSAKPSFLIAFAAAGLVWLGLGWAVLG